MPIRQVPDLITQLYAIVRKLNALFPGRPFTPDGHLVGSIGEVVAAFVYNLRLEKCSNPGFDAKTLDGRTVEIKLTAGKSVSIAEGPNPDLLLVLVLDQQHGFREAYNRKFPVELCEKRPLNKRRVRSISLAYLRKINEGHLEGASRLKELNDLFVRGVEP